MILLSSECMLVSPAPLGWGASFVNGDADDSGLLNDVDATPAVFTKGRACGVSSRLPSRPSCRDEEGSGAGGLLSWKPSAGSSRAYRFMGRRLKTPHT